MEKLTSMKNIGKELERKLKTIDVHQADDLKRLGSKETFFQLKKSFPEVCLVHLYALEGAIMDIEFNKLPEETKVDLKKFAKQINYNLGVRK